MIKMIYSLFYQAIFGRMRYLRKIGVTIGKNCRIYTTYFGSEPFLVKIGDNVTITSGVRFVTHDGSAWLMRDDLGRRYSYQPIEIGNSIFIGINSIILPGVKIEDNVIVAAGSVVTKSIPKGAIVGGTPAKIIGYYDDLRSKMLSTYVSESEVNKELTYKKRILELVNYNMKPFLSNK